MIYKHHVLYSIIGKLYKKLHGGRIMKKAVIQLLEFGWPDRIIANYLMIKPTIVKYYRRKQRITRDEYQGFY